VNLLERRLDTLVRDIDHLRKAVRGVRHRYPFHTDAWVVLPAHLHCIWTLPEGDADFSTRWRLIKAAFAKALPVTERRSAVWVARQERALSQWRFWEYAIHDERDYAQHMDYVHYNPVKHGMSPCRRLGGNNRNCCGEVAPGEHGPHQRGSIPVADVVHGLT
jgi:putative transposase